MENPDKPDIKGFIFLVIVCGLFYFFSPSARADGIKCVSKTAESIKLEKQFAGVIFDTWRKAGHVEPAKELMAKARYTAWYILRDNNLICRPRK